jgi:hypothetical protein
MNLNPGGCSRIRALAMLALVSLLIAACGPLGDDDDPTATSETISQPTTEPEESAAPGSAGESGDGTPQTVIDEISDLIVNGLATPSGTPVVVAPDAATPPLVGSEAFVSTPAAPGSTDSASAATPLPPGETTANESERAPLAGSDGTSGATPPPWEPENAPATAGAPEASPGGTPGLAVLEESTPPVDVDLDSIDPVTANSCEPSDVPLLVDGELSYVTTTDVNFRTGPGSDCDTIGDGPLGSSIPVAVMSAPVVREGEEEYTWVQIRVNDIIGWVVVDFIEPAD